MYSVAHVREATARISLGINLCLQRAHTVEGWQVHPPIKEHPMDEVHCILYIILQCLGPDQGRMLDRTTMMLYGAMIHCGTDFFPIEPCNSWAMLMMASCRDARLDHWSMFPMAEELFLMLHSEMWCTFAQGRWGVVFRFLGCLKCTQGLSDAQTPSTIEIILPRTQERWTLMGLDKPMT